MAEACVKQMKKIVRATWNKDQGKPNWDALTESVLLYYNTPRHEGASPSQLLFGHPTRDTLPAHRRAFSDEWQRQADEVEAKAELMRGKVTERYNARARLLPSLCVGQLVVMQDNRSKKWDKCGTVVEVGENRDYLMKLSSGRIFRRNRRFLRTRVPRLFNDSKETPVDSNSNANSNLTDNEPIRTSAQYRTRYGRHVKAPDRLQVGLSGPSYDLGRGDVVTCPLSDHVLC